MTNKEVLDQQVAGDNYGLSLEDSVTRSMLRGRLTPDERKAFDAGWEAAKQYYTERDAKIAEAMRPTGGRMWTDEQHACFSALNDCATNIRTGNQGVQD